MNSKTILLVEDEHEILLTNKEFLKRQGYAVLTAITLEEATATLKNSIPDLILLDINLPDGNGLDFISSTHSLTARPPIRPGSSLIPTCVPVIFLTARTDSIDMITGLERGGCDYITKPYDFGVLIARIRAQLRAHDASQEIIRRGELALNLLSQQAFLKGEDLLLTQKEFSLLLLFMKNEGKTMSAEYIYEKIWGQGMMGSISSLRNFISKLRRKIETSGYELSAVYDEGYRFEKEW